MGDEVHCPACGYSTMRYSEVLVCPNGCNVGDYRLNRDTNHTPPHEGNAKTGVASTRLVLLVESNPAYKRAMEEAGCEIA